MKYLVILFALIILAAYSTQNDLTDEKVTLYEKECQIEAGVTDAENADPTPRDPEARTMQCMRSCILKKWGVMNEEGRLLNDENAKKTFVFLLKGRTTEEVAGSIVDICNGEVGSDDCETASAYAKCIRTELTKRAVSSKLV